MPELVDGQITDRGALLDGSNMDRVLSVGAPRERSRVRTGYDELAARRSLREQIAKLERELAALFATSYPRRGLEWRVRSPGGPRLLGGGGLEELRGELATRLEKARGALRERASVERGYLSPIDEMLGPPERAKWIRVSKHGHGETGGK